MGIYLLTIAIILLIFSKFISGGIILLSSYVFLGIGTSNLITYRKNSQEIHKVKQLKENNQIQELMELNKKSKKPINWAVYALIDLKVEEMIGPLFDHMKTPQNNSEILKVVDALIIKLGYPNREAILKEIYMISPTKKEYILKKKPEKVTGMISGLPLNLEEDEIVICPFCGNYAKKELMNKWLQKKNPCPVCRKKILFAECPTVRLEKNKSR